jgi:hypothetical protein
MAKIRRKSNIPVKECVPDPLPPEVINGGLGRGELTAIWKAMTNLELQMDQVIVMMKTQAIQKQYGVHSVNPPANVCPNPAPPPKSYSPAKQAWG